MMKILSFTNSPEASALAWRRVCTAAVLLYLLGAALLVRGGPGLQYDEALFQHGAVHMLACSGGPPPFVHDAGSWVPFAGRYWPLMVLPYAGAVKHYVLLAPFAVFGTEPAAARMTAALLGALGIWGIGRLLREQVSGSAAAFTSMTLAVHPSYLVQTVFDNGAIASWMAALGLLAVALNEWLRERSRRAAFWLGLTLGLGVWVRLNFVWFLAAAAAAGLLLFGKRAWELARQGAPLISGVLLGATPALLYQVLSHGAAWQFVRAAQSSESWTVLLWRRLGLLVETLISDREYRVLWQGPYSVRAYRALMSGPPNLPGWQVWFCVIVLSAAMILAWRHKEALWLRASVLTFLLFAAIMLVTPLGIAQHHLVALVPIAAVAVVLALQTVPVRAACAVGLLYLGTALYWDLAAIQGIHKTGGVGMWSDAIFTVHKFLESRYPGREIQILDWGLQNNLYVLSQGRILSRETFSGTPEIVPGRLYLTNADDNLHFEAPTAAFRAALARSCLAYQTVPFSQRTGERYAELVEVLPPAAQRASACAAPVEGTRQ